MYSEKLRAIYIGCIGLLIEIERFKQILFFGRQCGRYHRRGTILRMGFSNLQKCLHASIHEIMPAASVNMEVDKAGCDIMALGVDHLGIREIHVAGFNTDNDAIFNQNRPVTDVAVGGDDGSVYNL